MNFQEPEYEGLHPENHQTKQKEKLIDRIKKNKVKFAAVFFAAIVVLCGLLFIFRALFSRTTPTNNIEDFLNGVFNENPPADIGTFIDFKKGSSKSFGNNITSAFTPDYESDKFWIKLKTEEGTVLGYVNNDEDFVEKYQIDMSSEQVRRYSDDSFSYITYAKNEEPKFYFQEADGELIKIISLSPGELFTSTFFDPVEKLFYISYKDTDNIINITALNFNNKSYPIFESSFLGASSQIINIKDNSIFVRNAGKCYELTIEDKQLNEIKCSSVIINAKGEVFSTNSIKEGIYTNFVTGEIYTQKPSDETRKNILTGKDGEVFSKLNYHNNAIYFLSQNLEQVEGSTWIAQDKKIEFLTLGKLERSEITTKLPENEIIEVINSGVKLYVVTRSGSEYFLEKYVESGFLPESPVSGPVSSEVQFWEIVDLKYENILELSLLKGDFITEI